MHIRGLLLCLASLGAAPVVLPRIPLGKDTTRVLGPLDAWGHVDYAAAINERRTKEIKPADNAAVLLWRAIGPRPEGALASDKHFTILGMERPPEKGEYFVDLGQYAAQRLKLKGEKAQPLALASTLNAPTPHNVIQIVRNGIRPPKDARDFAMPAFGWMSDQDLAKLLAFLRGHFTKSPPWQDVEGAIREVRAGGAH